MAGWSGGAEKAERSGRQTYPKDPDNELRRPLRRCRCFALDPTALSAVRPDSGQRFRIELNR